MSEQPDLGRTKNDALKIFMIDQILELFGTQLSSEQQEHLTALLLNLNDSGYRFGYIDGRHAGLGSGLAAAYHYVSGDS